MKSLAECIERALALLPAQSRERFVSDPFHVLTDDLKLKVRPAHHLGQGRADGGTCDGMSFVDDGVILYAPTGNRRENFTLAHELGHWLVEQVDEIYDWLLDQRQPAAARETLCDRLASRLLIPEAVLDDVVGDGPAEASHVAALFEATNASLPVCAIALAGRLTSLGAVIVVDRDTWKVTYASVQPHPVQGWPVVHPWPGQELPAGHPLRFLQPGATTRRRSFWATAWGKREDFYLDAYAGPRRAVAVLADADLWGVDVFHPQAQREFDQRPEVTVRCCGQTRTFRAYPHPDCGEAHCPVCGKCGCDRRAAGERQCAGTCGMQLRANLLDENGLCEECRP